MTQSPPDEEVIILNTLADRLGVGIFLLLAATFVGWFGLHLVIQQAYFAGGIALVTALGLGLLAFATSAKPTQLRLSKRGLRIQDVIRDTFLPWEDVAEFTVWREVRGFGDLFWGNYSLYKRVAAVYSDRYVAMHRPWRKFRLLPAIYFKNPSEIAGRLNTWLRNADV